MARLALLGDQGRRRKHGHATRRSRRNVEEAGKKDGEENKDGEGQEKMKLASYIADGKPTFGVVAGDGVVTLSERLKNRYATLKDVIAADAFDEVRRATEGAKPDHDIKG